MMVLANNMHAYQVSSARDTSRVEAEPTACLGTGEEQRKRPCCSTQADADDACRMEG